MAWSLWRRAANIPQGWLCLGAGGLTALAFAPFKWHFIPFATLAVLFAVWRGNNGKQAFRNGFLFGLGLFGVGVSWLHVSIHLFAGVNLAGAWALALLLAAYLALFPAVAGWLGGLRPAPSERRHFLALMPALWALSEWGRARLFTGFPWLSAGYTQTESALSGYGALVGVFGVSFITAFLAGVLALGLRSTRKSRFAWVALLFAGVFVLGWLAGQLPWTRPVGDAGLRVAIIQAAVPQELKWRPEHKQASLERYLSLTAPFWDYDLIIWPETAIPAYLHEERAFIDSLEATAKARGAVVLLGLPVKELDTGADFNSVLLLGAEERQLYRKRRLVPFGEYVPLKPLFGRLTTALGIALPDFSPGDRSAPPVLRGTRFSVGASICYEAAFGHEIAQALPEAGLLVNVSNDAWFGDSASPHQHLQMAQMRAIETGRQMARAANTGISALIDEKGRIIGKTAQFKPDAVAARLSLFTGRTPYTATGDWPVAAASLLLLLLAPAGPLGRRGRWRLRPGGP